jgi:hypothetical protein
MATYRVTEASINIHAGILVLNNSQAQARKHRLSDLGHSRYEVTDPPVTFKRGEVVGLEGELPKGMGHSVEEVEPDREDPYREIGMDGSRSKRKQK